MAKLGNLASRFLVALVALPLVLLIIYMDRPEPTWALVLFVTILAMYELFVMTLPDDRTDRIASTVAGVVAAVAMYWLSPAAFGEPPAAITALQAAGPLLVMILAIIPITLYYLFRFGDMRTVAPRIAYSITGIVYVGLLLSFLALVKRDFGPNGGHMIVFILVVAWVGDTGAYFAGRFLGKRKLYPEVSPKKTWAGAIGGLAASAASGAVVGRLVMDGMPWLDIFALSIPGAALGQMGDLVESLIKRSTGVKDSGAILPGHGGMLDRVDAVLFLAPYVYAYMMIRAALS